MNVHSHVPRIWPQHGVAVGSNGTILRTENAGERWKRVDKNLREWLYAVTFADGLRGYAVGARGIILRTDDGGANWKDVESGLSTNLFAVAVGGRDDVLVALEGLLRLSQVAVHRCHAIEAAGFTWPVLYLLPDG